MYSHIGSTTFEKMGKEGTANASGKVLYENKQGSLLSKGNGVTIASTSKRVSNPPDIWQQIRDTAPEILCQTLTTMNDTKEMEAKVAALATALAGRRQLLAGKPLAGELSANNYIDCVTLVDSSKEEDQEDYRSCTCRLSGTFSVGGGDLKLSLNIETVDTHGEKTVTAECELWGMEEGEWGYVEEEDRKMWAGMMAASQIEGKMLKGLWWVSHMLCCIIWKKSIVWATLLV